MPWRCFIHTPSPPHTLLCAAVAGKPSQRIDVGGIVGTTLEEADRMNRRGVFWGTFDVVDEEELIEEEIVEHDGTRVSVCVRVEWVGGWMLACLLLTALCLRPRPRGSAT